MKKVLAGVVIGIFIGIFLFLGYIDYQNTKARVSAIENFLNQAIKTQQKQMQAMSMSNEDKNK